MNGLAGDDTGAGRAARFALEAFVIAAAVLPLYLLAKQSVSPELKTFAWPPHWLPHRPTLDHFVSIFEVNELRGAILRSLAVAAISAAIATALGAMVGACDGAQRACAARWFFDGVGYPLAADDRGCDSARDYSCDAWGLRFTQRDRPGCRSCRDCHSDRCADDLRVIRRDSAQIEEAAWIDGASPLANLF